MRSASVTDWSTARPGILPPGEIHIWRYPLQVAMADTGILSSDERQRLARLTHPAYKRSWCNSRLVLRLLLGDYLGCPPHSLEFRTSERGKPFLPGHPLHFNLSHSGEWGLLALARNFPLGVDLEEFRPVEDPLSLARRMFSLQEQEELAGCPFEERERRFFELWTLMEARQKLTGEGLFGETTPPEHCRTLPFLPDTGHAAALAWPAATRPVPATAFFQFDPGKG